jgi:hypothetical protein
MKRTYTIEEASQILNISIGVLKIELKRLNVQKLKKNYIITDSVINDLKRTETKETKETNEDEMISETFTKAQYEKLQSVIEEYPILIERLKNYQNQIEYLRGSLDKQSDQMTLLIETMQSSIKTIEQRNFIEATNKQKPL